MMVLKTSREIDCLREAGRIAADALSWAGRNAVPGRTTAELDATVATKHQQKSGRRSDGVRAWECHTDAKRSKLVCKAP